MMRHNIATRSCLSVVASHIVKRTNHVTIPQGGSSSSSSSSSWLPLPFRVQDYRTLRNEESSNLSEGSNHEGARQRWRELPPVPPQMALQALLQSQNYETKADMVEGRVLEGQGKVKPLTALRWVSKCCPDVPQSLINKLFRLCQIRVRSSSPLCEPSSVSSGQRLNRVSGKEVLKEGAVLVMPVTVITLRSQEGMEVSGKTMHALGRTTHEPTPEEIGWLRSLILHMDKELIIINKPCGLAVQGGTEVRRSLDSMMGAALSFNYSEGPRLVHRLDKETSGAMVIGRTHQSTVFLHALLRIKSSEMTQLWKGHGQNIERRYWALVVGTPTKLQGRISSPLAKVSTSGGKLEKMRVTHRSHPDAQEAITDYQVLGPSALGCTWLELHPLTGRKHQAVCKSGSEKIGAEELAQVEEMRVNPFAARICELFSDDGSDKLTFMMFLNVMSTFSKETHADVKMVWIFALWDFDGDDILGPDDIMQGINLLTCSGVAIQPSLASLHRVPSSEGLDLIELDDLVSKVVDESDPQNEGLGYMDFRGLLLRMPDLLANFEITIR